MKLFKNRADAGRRLAQKLGAYKGLEDALVLALPRGGVPVAYEVALALGLPLDVFVVRKLGTPGQEELALGAIATGGARVFNPQILSALNLSQEALDRIVERESLELARREAHYRGERPPVRFKGRTVILVDDGLATGASMRAAVLALQAQDPREIVVAVPVGAPETCQELEAEVGTVVCAKTPQPFYGVGMWYEDFSQTTDVQVRELLERAFAARGLP